MSLFERKRIPEFPAEHEFETVIVRNDSPRPSGAPKEPAPVLSLSRLLMDNGWQTAIGYSQAWRRGQRTGTYRRAEFFGVYAFGHECGYLVTAIHWRFADKTEEFAWFRDTMALEQTQKACGTPGQWTWQDTRIIRGFSRHRTKVTDVKEFAKVRGSVLPGWFAGIERRFIEQAAKALCGDLEEHTPHAWDTATGTTKSCSGKASKPKETEGI